VDNTIQLLDEITKRIKRKIVANRLGRSFFSISKLVAKNEALYVINKYKGETEILRDAIAKAFTLDEEPVRGISPFNPRLGFYVWSVEDLGYLRLEIFGRNIDEAVESLVIYIISKAYKDVSFVHERYYIDVLISGTRVGRIFSSLKGGKSAIIAKIGRDKLTALYRRIDELLIEVLIYMPKNVKEVVLNDLYDMKDAFDALIFGKIDNEKISLLLGFHPS